MEGKIPKPRPRVSHFKVFTRDAYNKTDGYTEFRRSVDKDIVLKLEEVTKLKYVDKVLYDYRIHKKNISRDPGTKPHGKDIVAQAKKRRLQV